MEKKLNCGCGTDVKYGWINLDSAKLPGVDVVHDIEKVPLPFTDNYFDQILCQDILEHCDYIPVLRDLYRILKPKGTITIRVPHFTSKNNFTDPTHKKLFAARTFQFFTRTPIKGRDYYFDFSFSTCSRAHITFERSSSLFFFNALVEKLVNSSEWAKYLYESTFLSRLFPAENIIITLVK